jgi:hypothetical protein
MTRQGIFTTTNRLGTSPNPLKMPRARDLHNHQQTGDITKSTENTQARDLHNHQQTGDITKYTENTQARDLHNHQQTGDIAKYTENTQARDLHNHQLGTSPNPLKKPRARNIHEPTCT